ncbi:MAG: energy-coupling factor transporter transmembrane protein EcfT [Clostridia bacterium]|jgi:energy-coupling factor transport system permease protein|nr:energy-coupling factor transporter transmembrane protein EcfT [Clostridia bacterium]
MLKDITLGQYFPGNSVIHRLDPRMKVILAIAYIVAIFLAKSVFAFALVALTTLMLVIISRISVAVVLRGIKPIIYVVIFTMIINLFMIKGEGEPLFSLWRIRIYEEGIYRAVFMALRVIFLIMATSIFLTYTTSPFSLTAGIEGVLSPLKLIRLPVHDFAMMMMIALRFIPTLVEETDKIMNAQKARGADFSSGGLIKRAKALIPILVPLFVSAFNRANDLSVAMECRCYRSGKGATKLHKLKFSALDFVSLLIMAIFITAIVLINKYVTVGFSL